MDRMRVDDRTVAWPRTVHAAVQERLLGRLVSLDMRAIWRQQRQAGGIQPAKRGIGRRRQGGAVRQAGADIAGGACREAALEKRGGNLANLVAQFRFFGKDGGVPIVCSARMPPRDSMRARSVAPVKSSAIAPSNMKQFSLLKRSG